MSKYIGCIRLGCVGGSSKLVQDVEIELRLAAIPFAKRECGEKMPCARKSLKAPSLPSSVLLLEEQLAATSDGTGSLGGDETAFLTAGGVSPRRSWVTDVLMVTTTVGMLDGVHGDTSNSGPVSLLCV